MGCLADINAMSRADFVAAFADVAEHSPWVAEEAARARPFASRAAMIESFAAVVRQAPRERQLALLNAHPDLAGRAALAGEVAAASRREQASAGLDQLSADELARFHDFNNRYRARFGFPFILAVRGAGKKDILDSFAQRIDNPVAVELENAIGQVCRIIAFRLEDMVTS